MLFYAGLILFHGRTALLALQLFNAIFIGIIAGIGMLWFQDLMPGRAGAATTLFTNSISAGVILRRRDAGGAVPELWSRQRLLDDRGHFAGDAVFDQQGEGYLTTRPGIAGATRPT